MVSFCFLSCCTSTACCACWERCHCSCERHSCSSFISSWVFCTSGPSSTVFFCWSASFFSRSWMMASLAWQLAVRSASFFSRSWMTSSLAWLAVRSASFFSRSWMTSSLASQLALSLSRSFWRLATRFALQLLCFVTDRPEPPSDPGPCQGSQRHRPSSSAPHSHASIAEGAWATHDKMN